jgi:hypothetical protein
MQFSIDSDSDEEQTHTGSSARGSGRGSRGRHGDTETIELYSKYLPQNASDVESSSRRSKKQQGEVAHQIKSSHGGGKRGGGGMWSSSAAKNDYRQVGESSDSEDADYSSKHGDDDPDLNPFQSRRR